MRATRTVGMLFLLLCCMGSILAQQPFTYQGMLKTSGIPANGNYDFQFSLWTANSGGSQVGSTITRIGVSVSNGLFTTELDFGSVWDGNERYLQIAVRPSGSGAYTTLSPRVKVNRVPYSQLAFGALSVPWSGIVGMPAGFADGVDNDTTYAAGAGLQLVGNTFSIASGGVVSAMLADGSVTTTKIADGAVTTAKIGDGQVTDAKIASVSWSKVTGAPSSFPPGGSAGGDLSGSYPNPTVAKIQGRAVASTAPSAGQVLKWDGSAWSPDTDLRDAFWQASGGNIFYNAGDVGIGTSSPLYSLHVETGTVDRAIYGLHTAATGYTFGVWGQSSSTDGRGLLGYASAATGYTFGVWGQSSSTDGTGVYGFATASSGNTNGVYGRSDSPDGRGVFGWATAASGTVSGVVGRSDSTGGTGVYGYASAASGFTRGVSGQSDSPDGTGVFGYASAPSGVTYGGWFRCDSTDGTGVFGYASAYNGWTVGVEGVSASPTGYGVYFVNRLAGTGTKSFQMDHPLHPETHYLNHFCTEGPEPYNAYRGTVVLDARGEAWVQLPDYFESINRDPSYHLTPIGAPMPNLHVAMEVQGNRFKIAGGVPGKKVSWRVEAIRNDRWVQEYGYQTEQPKPAEYRGKYLNPELYGQPKELGIHYRPELVRQ
ncbi:hypothetical protein HRbin16_01961 [bacterium HR16]|nr:hypothetical protein HRbin16_01961 [bacterium HR16]